MDLRLSYRDLPERQHSMLLPVSLDLRGVQDGAEIAHAAQVHNVDPNLAVLRDNPKVHQRKSLTYPAGRRLVLMNPRKDAAI